MNFELETERKFLVASDEWRVEATDNRAIVDHLIARFDLGKARIRLCDGTAVLTMKGNRQGLARSEYHIPIAWDLALSMIEEFSTRPALEKHRHDVPYGGLIWQIDEYAGSLKGLVTADVEIPSAEHPVALPPWAGPEITGDTRYSSATLAERLRS